MSFESRIERQKHTIKSERVRVAEEKEAERIRLVEAEGRRIEEIQSDPRFTQLIEIAESPELREALDAYVDEFYFVDPSDLKGVEKGVELLPLYLHDDLTTLLRRGITLTLHLGEKHYEECGGADANYWDRKVFSKRVQIVWRDERKRTWFDYHSNGHGGGSGGGWEGDDEPEGVYILMDDQEFGSLDDFLDFLSYLVADHRLR